MGIKSAFAKFFQIIECKTYGNALTACAEIQGIPAEYFTQEELLLMDPNYQILITLVVQK